MQANLQGSIRGLGSLRSLCVLCDSAGTELTINYELLDELAKTPVPRCIVFCRCGEDNCTRTII